MYVLPFCRSTEYLRTLCYVGMVYIPLLVSLNPNDVFIFYFITRLPHSPSPSFALNLTLKSDPRLSILKPLAPDGGDSTKHGVRDRYETTHKYTIVPRRGRPNVSRSPSRSVTGKMMFVLPCPSSQALVRFVPVGIVSKRQSKSMEK